jgi:hypothetical protein
LAVRIDGIDRWTSRGPGTFFLNGIRNEREWSALYLGTPVTADVPWIIDDRCQTKDLYIKNKFIKINIHQKDFTRKKWREI